MSTDIAEAATAVEEFAVGAARTAAEVASDPVRAARKQIKSLERKGTPAVRRINRRLGAFVPDRLEIFGTAINGKLPEKMATSGLRGIRAQAERQDLVGAVAKRTLRMFNGSFKAIARTAARLEQASELSPRRPSTQRSRPRAARRRAA